VQMATSATITSTPALSGGLRPRATSALIPSTTCSAYNRLNSRSQRSSSLGARPPMSERLEEEQLRKLVELGPAMVSELDLDIVLDRLLETGCSITGAGYAVIRIRDPQRRELERFVRRGVTAGQEEGPPTGVSLGVPVVIGERVWGNLYLTDKRGGGGFTASDQWAATMLAAWTAIAIEHGRLRTATIERQAALEDAIRRLEPADPAQ
jgi:hypothetical protein